MAVHEVVCNSGFHTIPNKLVCCVTELEDIFVNRLFKYPVHHILVSKLDCGKNNTSNTHEDILSTDVHVYE